MVLLVVQLHDFADDHRLQRTVVVRQVGQLQLQRFKARGGAALAPGKEGISGGGGGGGGGGAESKGANRLGPGPLPSAHLRARGHAPGVLERRARQEGGLGA